MPDDEQCGAAGPGGLTCTRVSGHEGSHTTYPDIDGETYHVEWFRCNPLGEPVEVPADAA